MRVRARTACAGCRGAVGRDCGVHLGSEYIGDVPLRFHGQARPARGGTPNLIRVIILGMVISIAIIIIVMITFIVIGVERVIVVGF